MGTFDVDYDIGTEFPSELRFWEDLGLGEEPLGGSARASVEITAKLDSLALFWQLISLASFPRLSAVVAGPGSISLRSQGEGAAAPQPPNLNTLIPSSLEAGVKYEPGFAGEVPGGRSLVRAGPSLVLDLDALGLGSDSSRLGIHSRAETPTTSGGHVNHHPTPSHRTRASAPDVPSDPLPEQRPRLR